MSSTPLARAELEAALLSENAEARASFRKRHECGLRDVAEACVHAYELLWPLYQLAVGDLRKDHSRAFLHVAFNSVLTATNLLVAGFPLPAGNQMRHATEAVAIALLLCDKESRVYEELLDKGARYPAQDAPGKLQQRRRWERLVRIFDLADGGREYLLDLQRFYSGFSHAGALAVAYHLHFGIEGAVIVGAEHDHGKDEYVPEELRSQARAFETIGELARQMAELFASEERAR